MIGAVENTTAPETAKLCAQYLGPALRLLNFNNLPFPINPYLRPAPNPDNIIYTDPKLAPGGAGPGDPPEPAADGVGLHRRRRYAAAAGLGRRHRARRGCTRPTERYPPLRRRRCSLARRFRGRRTCIPGPAAPTVDGMLLPATPAPAAPPVRPMHPCCREGMPPS